MDRMEILALKLQMGISPSAWVAPNVLLNMWQQLKLECDRAARFQSREPSNPNQTAGTPMVV